MAKLWSFKTRKFEVSCTCDEADFDPGYMEADMAEECQEKIASGEWQCFDTTVQVVYRPTGEVIGEDTLGNSIYPDPRDFVKEHVGIRARSRQDGRNYGSYFSDMVHEAIAAARTHSKGLKLPRVKTRPPVFGL